MIKLKLYPPSGTVEDARSLKFEISGVDVDPIRVHIENATHGSVVEVTSLQNMGDGTYIGFADVKVPSHLHQSLISIFAHIEKQEADGSYRTLQICPTIFTIVNEIEGASESLSVSPSFVGTEDLCSIRLVGKPNSKKVVSINGKFFKTTINNEGFGSVGFKGKDVIGDDDIDTVYQLPIYLYGEEDNFTKKVFSDFYLNILPSSIAMHASIDPRCDPNSDDYVDPPGSWTIPTACTEPPEPPITEPVDPVIPPTALPTTCRKETVDISDNNICRIHHNSATLLNNGMVVHAYTSPDVVYNDSDDSRFNINKIFIAKQQSTLDVQIINSRDVVVEEKLPGELFQIHVEEDLWESLSGLSDPSAIDSDIYVVLFDKSIGFQRINIIDRTIDEYTGSHILIGEMENDVLLIQNWIFCVNAVFYHSTETPDLYMDTSDYNSLPYITDEDDNYLQILNSSIASNIKYVGKSEESYIYVIAEVLKEGSSQLFFIGFTLGKNDTVNREDSGWFQLTHSGNNQNPTAMVDSDNNLHVVWQSDRAGIKQLYYGVLGNSPVPSAGTAFSSCIDKYSDFLSSDDVPFDYLSGSLLTQISSDIYNPSQQVPEYDSDDLVNSSWVIYSPENNITQSSGDSYVNDLTISANALTEDAMAFNSLQIVDLTEESEDVENPSVPGPPPYSQFNYQISFDLSANVSQESDLASSYQGIIVDDKEMDNIFDEWKTEFTLTTDTDVKNESVYMKNSNKFVIGRNNNIFDRIVPIVGSYKHDNQNPSTDRFQINITDQSNNLKDFTFGLMFEKTIFTATNISTSSEFSDDNPSEISYIESEIHIIYTGMAKLVAFIKTEDVEEDRANYIIVREFPEKIDVIDSKTYTIISNYTKLNSDGTESLIDTYQQTYSDKFLGQITLLIDSVARFSQSFISTISGNYNYFDIGFGIPNGGYYIADKMSPSKLGVFENVVANLIFSNINITSPTYTFNTDIINLPPSVRDMTKLRVEEIDPYVPASIDLLSLGIPSLINEEIVYSVSVAPFDVDYSELFDTSLVEEVSVEFITYGAPDKMIITKEDGTILIDTGFIVSLAGNPFSFDVDVTSVNNIYINVTRGQGSTAYEFVAYFKTVNSNTFFTQVPITFEGINQSPNIDLGICNDVHISWQSNRDTYWNIFYSSSNDKLSPFRFDTMITNTKSNSLKPDVTVGRGGSRLITWHDDRNGNYDIFAARSIEGMLCNEDKCKKEMAEAFEDEIVECNIEIEYDANVGDYSLSLLFYKDTALTDLYTTIEVDNDTKDRWFVDFAAANISYDVLGNAVGVVFSIDDTVTVSYVPDKDDGIFDIVLYVKLSATELGGA